MNNQIDLSLSSLIDIHSITDVLHRYCHACDHINETGLRDCFHSDAILEHGPFSGPVEQWIGGALAWLEGRVGVTHMIANPLIRIDGDRALSDCHFVAFNRLPKSGDRFEEVIVKGRYIDRFERRSGRWRVAHRIGIHDLESIRDVPGALPPIAGAFRSGAMSDDPYFAMLALFLDGR